MEQWRDIVNFTQYQVSDHGNIKSERTNRVMALNENQYGVVVVGLMRNGQQKHRSVPLLVASAFIHRKYDAWDTPINLDGNRRNNHVNNLVWRPRWFAVQYNRQFRVPFEYAVLHPIQDCNTGEVYSTSFECARANGVLERDVVMSIANNTIVWPTHQKFRIVD